MNKPNVKVALADQQVDPFEGENPYHTFLRMRRINGFLTIAVLWACVVAFLATAFGVAGVFYRPSAPIIGLDPAGRKHTLTLIQGNAQPPAR